MEPFSTWLRAATTDNSRSSVLAALRPLLILSYGGAVVNGVLHGPDWLTIGMFVCGAAATVLALAAFGFFVVKDPAALRSERFGIRKMEIERGWFGDNTHGLKPAIETEFARAPDVLGGKGD